MTARIDSIGAWVVDDPKTGAEQVISVDVPGLGAMPLIDARPERIAQMREWAIKVADTTGHTVRLVQFATRTDLETIEPR